MDALIAIPIGIIYNLFIGKLADVITSDNSLKDKIQNTFIVQIFGGILALIFAFFIFDSKRLYNRVAKWGFILGAMILLGYSLIGNWNIIENNTKLFVIGIALLFTIFYSYNTIKTTPKELIKQTLKKTEK